MAFDIRCPECKAKLRLDEEPDPDTAVECPKCGSKFTSTLAAMAAASGSSGGGTATKTKPEKAAKSAGTVGKKKKGKKTKKKLAKKKRTNPLILLIAIAFGFGGLVVVGFLMMWFLNRAGKVEEMLAFVPGECNWVRGINTGQLAKYPGYSAEVDKFNTSAVRAGVDDLAKATNLPAENYLDYLVIAKSRTEAGTQTLYVLRSGRSFNAAEAGKNLSGATQTDVNGEPCYRISAAGKGILANSLVYFPTSKIAVVVPPGRGQEAAIRASVAAKSNKPDSFGGKLDTTGKIVIRGSIWLIVKSEGSLKNWLSGNTALVKTDLPEITKKGATAQTFGCWTTPGGSGVRVGCAMQCESSSEARGLVKSIQSGTYGKGDEYTLTSEVRSYFQISSDKKVFGELMQYVDFRTQKECAYMVSKCEGEGAKTVMAFFNKPSMASDEGEGGGGGMMGLGGPGIGGPAPGGPGLPGGVAMPGIGGPGR